MLSLKPIAPVVAACLVASGPLCMVASAAPTSYKAMTIAITQVRGEDSDVSDAIYNSFRNKVIAMQRFTVLERDDQRMKQVIKEAAFGESGLVDKDSAPKIGQLLGAGYMTFLEYHNFRVSYEPPAKKGEHGTYKCNLTATARFVNTETGVALHAFTTTGSGSDKNRAEAVAAAVDHVVSEMILSTREIFALKGMVVGRDGRSVVIDVGQQQGLAADTYFNVVRDVNGIRKKMGMIRIDDVGAQRSEGVIKEGFYQIKEGDVLEENARASKPFGIGAFYEYTGLTGRLADGFTSPSGKTFAQVPGSGSLVGLSLKAPELFSDWAGLSLSGGMLVPSNSGIGAGVFDLTANLHWEVVPEWLSLEARLGPSLASIWQDRANMLNPPSTSTDSPGVWGFGGTAGLNAVLHLGRNARVYAGAGYRVMASGTTWSGGSDKDDTAFTVPAGQIAYPNANIGGLTIQAGLDGQF